MELHNLAKRVDIQINMVSIPYMCLATSNMDDPHSCLV
jgi:hypothetical protein